MDMPDVHYARSGGVSIAYQVVGDGPQNLVLSPHVSDLFTFWLNTETRSFVERLATRARIVVLNPRGTGLSDRPRNVTLEARMDDISAVLDDLGVKRASVAGIGMSANASALFAASYPERIERLVLVQPFPRAIRSDSYPWGYTEDEWLGYLREVRDNWGKRSFMEEYARDRAPLISKDSERLELFIWGCRLALSPTAAVDWFRVGMEADIIDVLGSIRVPTLVLHRREDHSRTADAVEAARFVAERIPGARTALLPAVGESPYSPAVSDAIVEFLRDEVPITVPDSVLATVLFTDLVASTERAAALGDRAWRDVLSRHHDDVRRELARYRGDEVDSAGDGFFCRFDGPARAIACARAIVDAAKQLNLDVRAGIHTGECELVGEKIAGISVVTGSRISSLAASGEVLVSSTVKDLVAGSGFLFEDRGEHDLRGVPGLWRLYAVASS
jgi:class 3 adenylate cyclase